MLKRITAQDFVNLNIDYGIAFGEISEGMYRAQNKVEPTSSKQISILKDNFYCQQAVFQQLLLPESGFDILLPKNKLQYTDRTTYGLENLFSSVYLSIESDFFFSGSVNHVRKGSVESLMHCYRNGFLHPLLNLSMDYYSIDIQTNVNELIYMEYRPNSKTCHHTNDSDAFISYAKSFEHKVMVWMPMILPVEAINKNAIINEYYRTADKVIIAGQFNNFGKFMSRVIYLCLST